MMILVNCKTYLVVIIPAIVSVVLTLAFAGSLSVGAWVAYSTPLHTAHRVHTATHPFSTPTCSHPSPSQSQAYRLQPRWSRW